MAIMRSVSLYEELYLEYFFYFSLKILFSDKIISTFIKLYFSNNLFVFLYLYVKLIPDTVYAFYIIRYVWCNFQFFLKLLMWLFIAFREYSLYSSFQTISAIISYVNTRRGFKISNARMFNRTIFKAKMQ